MLDAEGRPFRAATCWSRAHCDVSGPTRLGFIWYQAAGDQPATADWAAFEAHLLPLIESWRVPG